MKTQNINQEATHAYVIEVYVTMILSVLLAVGSTFFF